LRLAQSEAEASFDDPSIYIEKYIEEPRHIEFQILADHYGNIVHLGERDCSIQRKHQKLVEESPSSAISYELREKMGVTIKEIAAVAKVSTATVSLALNNKPGISKATRQKILKIAQSLNEKRDKQSTFAQVIKGSIRFLKIVKHGHVLSRDHEVFISRYIENWHTLVS